MVRKRRVSMQTIWPIHLLNAFFLINWPKCQDHCIWWLYSNHFDHRNKKIMRTGSRQYYDKLQFFLHRKRVSLSRNSSNIWLKSVCDLKVVWHQIQRLCWIKPVWYQNWYHLRISLQFTVTPKSEKCKFFFLLQDMDTIWNCWSNDEHILYHSTNSGS